MNEHLISTSDLVINIDNIRAMAQDEQGRFDIIFTIDEIKGDKALVDKILAESKGFKSLKTSNQMLVYVRSEAITCLRANATGTIHSYFNLGRTFTFSESLQELKELVFGKH